MLIPHASVGAAVRPIVLVLGVLVAVMGTVWALQGVGVLLGSFMSNDPMWLWIGVGTVVLGMVLILAGYRMGPSMKAG